jgi:hypothetical protein
LVAPQSGPVVLECEGEEVPDLKDRFVEDMAFAAVPLDLWRYWELQKGVSHWHEVKVEQGRSANQLGVGEVPSVADPHQHGVRRRAVEVVYALVVRLRNPLLDVVGLRRHQALDSNPVRHDSLRFGVKFHVLTDDHRADDRFHRRLELAHPAVVAIIAERAHCRGEEGLSVCLPFCRATPPLGMSEAGQRRQKVVEPCRPDVFLGDLPVRGPTEATWVRHQSRVRDRSDKSYEYRRPITIKTREIIMILREDVAPARGMLLTAVA